jgi:hypothetical protein
LEKKNGIKAPSSNTLQAFLDDFSHEFKVQSILSIEAVLGLSRKQKSTKPIPNYLGDIT